MYQQYLVDQWAKIELHRLRWIRTHQAQLRSDLYQGVQDSLNNQEVENSGRLIILPATFTGGDRYMYKCFQNAMALI